MKKFLIAALAITVFIVIVFFLKNCKKEVYNETEYVSDELILYLNKELTNQAKSELKIFYAKKLNIDTTEVSLQSCKCDQNLIKLTADGVAKQFLDGQGPVAKIPIGTNGDAIPPFEDMPDDLLTSIISAELNIIIRENPTDSENLYGSDPIKFSGYYTPNTNQQEILIGILDSGLYDESDLDKNYIWKNNNTTAEDKYGWNFVDNNNNIIDKKNYHGNNVAALLVNDLVISRTPAKILNLKVLDKNNTGEMFNILCAILYSYQKNVDIINLSLGYFGEESMILEKILSSGQFKHPITKEQYKDKIIVAAAGNQDQRADSLELNSTLIDLNNLEIRKNKFYPSYYAKKLNHVFSITTIDSATNQRIAVAKGQSYSPIFVDGVLADDGRFFNGISGSSGKYCGSSYAAPIFTAKIAKYLSLSNNKNINQKKDLRRLLRSELHSNLALKPSVLNGQYIKREQSR